jgi:hypothetical protein
MKHIGDRFEYFGRRIKVVESTHCDDCIFAGDICLVHEDDEYECRKGMRDDNIGIIYLLDKFCYGK